MIGNLGKIAKNVATGFFNKTLNRLRGAGISTDSRLVQARAKWSGRSDKTDWRVRLQVPDNSPIARFFDFENNELMKPLAEAGGIFWPLTPTMQIQHSQIESLSIIGEFPVQNSEDAKHWVATVNFLRTASKMFFGQDDKDGLKGNPPPILHFYGYGDHMFNKIPVVISSFNVELRQGIDYISTKQHNTPYKQLNGPDEGFFMNAEGEDQTWAPSLSNISCVITPIYSRESMKNFSMKKFVRGELNGKGTNEIGFI